MCGTKFDLVMLTKYSQFNEGKIYRSIWEELKTWWIIYVYKNVPTVLTNQTVTNNKPGKV